jgi:acyl carrier protein
MDQTSTATVEDVKSVVISTLDLADRGDALEVSTPLLGSLPELDSMAVLELLCALEERFGVAIDDDDVSADIFETLGSLAAFIDGKLADR